MIDRRTFLIGVGGGVLGSQLATGEPERELVPVYRLVNLASSSEWERCRMSELVVGDLAIVNTVCSVVTSPPEQLPDGVWSVVIESEAPSVNPPPVLDRKCTTP